MRLQSDVIQSWTDGRLAPVTKDTKDIYLGLESSGLLWTPVLSVWNNREDSSFVPQDKQRIVLLTANGRIIMEQRSSITVCLSVCMCTRVPVCLLPISCLRVCLFVCLSMPVLPSASLSVYLSACLPYYLNLLELESMS